MGREGSIKRREFTMEEAYASLHCLWRGLVYLSL
jgi:hypothetical protein